VIGAPEKVRRQQDQCFAHGARFQEGGHRIVAAAAAGEENGA
jgi:hypothetical protein